MENILPGLRILALLLLLVAAGLSIMLAHNAQSPAIHRQVVYQSVLADDSSQEPGNTVWG